jgi:hypothetical protein
VRPGAGGRRRGVAYRARRRAPAHAPPYGPEAGTRPRPLVPGRRRGPARAPRDRPRAPRHSPARRCGGPLRRSAPARAGTGSRTRRAPYDRPGRVPLSRAGPRARRRPVIPGRTGPRGPAGLPATAPPAGPPSPAGPSAVPARPAPRRSAPRAGPGRVPYSLAPAAIPAQPTSLRSAPRAGPGRVPYGLAPAVPHHEPTPAGLPHRPGAASAVPPRPGRMRAPPGGTRASGPAGPASPHRHGRPPPVLRTAVRTGRGRRARSIIGRRSCFPGWGLDDLWRRGKTAARRSALPNTIRKQGCGAAVPRTGTAPGPGSLARTAGGTGVRFPGPRTKESRCPAPTSSSARPSVPPY